jgi:hypothetical protein
VLPQILQKPFGKDVIVICLLINYLILAEATETQVWLDFSLDCGYLSRESYEKLVKRYEEIGKMLGSMMSTPEKFKIL